MLKSRLRRIERQVIGKKGKAGYAIRRGRPVYRGPNAPVLSLRDLNESLRNYHESRARDREMEKDA